MPDQPDPLLSLLERQLGQASKERQAQTEAFTGALSGLRWELRILATVALILMAVITLARDGVFARIGIPGVTVETHGETTPTSTSARTP